MCVSVCVCECECVLFLCVYVYFLVGKQQDSVLCLEQHFRQRGKQFKREMDQLRSSNHKEMIFEVSHYKNCS